MAVGRRDTGVREEVAAQPTRAVDVVDVVERETAELLEDTDAVLAYGEEAVYVLEAREDR